MELIQEYEVEGQDRLHLGRRSLDVTGIYYCLDCDLLGAREMRRKD